MICAILETDMDGNIIDFNSFCKDIFHTEDLLGKKIDSFKTELEKLNLQITAFNKKKLYIIREVPSMNFLNVIASGSYDEIFVADKDGIAIFCNSAFEKHYGLKKEDILGKHVSYITKNGHADKMLMDVVFKTKKPVTYEQKTITGKTILNTSTPVLDDQRNIKYVVENCRDVTENMLLMNTLSNTRKQLEKYKQELLAIKSLDKKRIYFKSKKMSNIYNSIAKLAPKDVNILILGKSGTGKTNLAKMIHELSPRNEKKFISINCSTIPESLIESELFGYSKGAFTGALASGKEGLVKKADKGTLFLDEICELPFSMQAKLLELVQEKQYLPIGEIELQHIDTRIIAATNQDIEQMVKEKTFREDLYYRLTVASITIPPLNERKEDVSDLLDAFFSLFNIRYSSQKYMSDEVKEILTAYSWPGNIRELENLVEFLVINTISDKIMINQIPQNILTEYYNIDNFQLLKKPILYKECIDNLESKIIKNAYEKYGSSYKLAKALKVSQSTAIRLINRYCK
jgi:PAS domain S-box-containing protein